MDNSYLVVPAGMNNSYFHDYPANLMDGPYIPEDVGNWLFSLRSIILMWVQSFQPMWLYSCTSTEVIIRWFQSCMETISSRKKQTMNPFPHSFLAACFVGIYLLLGGWDGSLCWGPHRLLQTPPQQLHHELLSPHTPAMWILVGTSSVHAWAPAREVGCPRSTLHWHRSENTVDDWDSGNATNCSS